MLARQRREPRLFVLEAIDHALRVDQALRRVERAELLGGANANDGRLAAVARLEAREREKDYRISFLDNMYLEERSHHEENRALRTQLERYREALVYISRWLDAGLPTDDRDVRAIVGIATTALFEPSQGEPDPERVSVLARELGLREARASVALDGETQSIEPPASQGEPNQ